MSLISTPPVDRLAVRTYVMPFDPVILREALLRERYRGGQTFYVVPRIADLDDAAAFLAEHAPELKVARAHGQMGSRELDQVMNAFYDRQYDVLLSTSIVESVLDIPSANTLIVHCSDMFGLAQLYQLRGRVGRSKIRAYAYFTIPADARLTRAAEKRLKVLQSLDTLGAGFMLASHDLDIRGAGIFSARSSRVTSGKSATSSTSRRWKRRWWRIKGGEGGRDRGPMVTAHQSRHLGPDPRERRAPTCKFGSALDRRLRVESHDAIEAFAAELIDRFGPLPQEVRHLLDIVELEGASAVRPGSSRSMPGRRARSLSSATRPSSTPGSDRFHPRGGQEGELQPDHRLIYYAELVDA